MLLYFIVEDNNGANIMLNVEDMHLAQYSKYHLGFAISSVFSNVISFSNIPAVRKYIHSIFLDFLLFIKRRIITKLCVIRQRRSPHFFLLSTSKNES